MSDAPRIRLYCEGHEEHVVLDKLAEIGALPPNIDVAKPGERRDRPSGIEGIVYDLAGEIALGGTRNVAILDLDDRELGSVARIVCGRLRDELPGREVTDSLVSERMVNVCVTGGGSAILIGVGLPDDAFLDRLAIHSHAFDDYLVRLILTESIYAETSQLNEFDYATALHKLEAVAEIMRENGKPLDKSKRVLQMLMGITAFRPSPATLAQRLLDGAVKVGGLPLAVQMLQPLVDDISVAVGHLLGGDAAAS